MLGTILSVAIVCEGVALAICDRGMRANLAQGVTRDALRWAPGYWEKPELFSERGNTYRRGAILAAVLAVLTVLAMIVTDPLAP